VGEVKNFGNERHWVALHPGFYDSFLNQFVKDSKVWRSTDFRSSFWLRWWLVILEGNDLSLDLYSLSYLNVSCSRWHSRDREPPAPDRDLIGLVIPWSALLC